MGHPYIPYICAKFLSIYLLPIPVMEMSRWLVWMIVRRSRLAWETAVIYRSMKERKIYQRLVRDQKKGKLQEWHCTE